MIFLENSGSGRRYRFHGAFGSLAGAEKKEASTPGAFIRETMVGKNVRYVVMSPKGKRRNPTGRRAKSGHRSNSTEVRMAARRSKRRKGKARRKSRRAAGVALSNPGPSKRRSSRRRGARGVARRGGSRRRGARRNPPGILNALMGAAVDGLSVTGGVVAQNGVVRYVPDLLPATMANAGMLNPLLKDLGGVVAGAYLFHKVLGGDRARFVVAGQAHAAIARALRAANVPVVSTMLGEYDPMRLGIYTDGVLRSAPAQRALPAPRNNVSTLKGVGVYTDGMSSAPGIF